MILLKNIEIFKAGRFVDSNGTEATFTIDDLKKIADKYNNAIKENKNLDAPVILGHKFDTDTPAAGWIKQLYVVKDSLYADFTVNDDIYKRIQNEEFKKVSISIAGEAGNYEIVHIGLLGGVAPAVKGMESIKLNELRTKFIFNFCVFDKTKITIENIEQKNNKDNIDNKNNKNNKDIKEKNINKHNFNNIFIGVLNMNEMQQEFLKGLLEILNKSLPEGMDAEAISNLQRAIIEYFTANISKLQEEKKKETEEPKEPEKKEEEKVQLNEQPGNNTLEFSALQKEFKEELAKQEQKIKLLVQSNEEYKKEIRIKQFNEKAKELVTKGIIMPGHEAEYIKICEFAYTQDDPKFNFTEVFDKFITTAFYKQDENLFKDFSEGKERKNKATTNKSLNIPEWASADPAEIALTKKINEYAEKNKTTFEVAFDTLSKKGEI